MRFCTANLRLTQIQAVPFELIMGFALNLGKHDNESAVGETVQTGLLVTGGCGWGKSVLVENATGCTPEACVELTGTSSEYGCHEQNNRLFISDDMDFKEEYDAVPDRDESGGCHSQGEAPNRQNRHAHGGQGRAVFAVK